MMPAVDGRPVADGRPVHRASLRLYRAVEDPGRCERFFGLHLEILRQFGMLSLTSLGRDWFTNPNVYVAEVEGLDDGELLAGARLHVADGRHELPTERAFTLGPGVRDFVKGRLADGIAESCGGWVSRKLAKLGVFHVLACTTFAIAAPLGVRLVMGSCGDYSLDTLLKLGCVVERSLGDAGTFTYPTPDRLSYFWVVRDPLTMADGTPEYRDLTLDLRRRPRQHRRLEGRHAVLDLEIDLTLRESRAA